MSTALPLPTTPAARKNLAEFYRKTLLEDALPFWFPRALDTKHGGYLHCLNRDGAIVDTDKNVWAQGRSAWMLLTLYNTVEKNPDWLAWAESGLQFLDDHCFDTDGRMFFHVAQDGTPIRKRRYAYSESFAAIAFAAHAKATGNQRSAQRALELFQLFVHWNFTPGQMPPKDTGKRPLIGLAPRMITLVTAQEIRANLGTTPLLEEWITRCIDEIRTLFCKPDIRAVMECVNPDGSISDHFDGRTLNPGHAIEGAWFIMHEGKIRNDASLVRLGCDMLDWMWERGWDKEFGGLLYFCDVYGKPVQEYWQNMKFWWPHNEALIATALAYDLTGEEHYALKHEQVRAWSFQHFSDPQHGEWFGYLNRDGSISSTLKGSLWKSFFHHPRALWHCWQIFAQEKEI
ncbi:MAG: AGE family epimerase/isomerase [Puniceicoccales bacterium]|jgi:N-acylglucosamine 2-epimerase|nr:AGE family epimerase/isomerase [Puniceicoccales bacterium]